MNTGLVFIIVCVVVFALVSFINSKDERKAKRLREEKDRERIRSLQDSFKKLQVKIITDSQNQPLAFKSLFDATHECTGEVYSYPKIRDLYFVVNGTITSQSEAEIIAKYIEEFYSVYLQYSLYPQSTSDKKSICIIEQSQEARIEKARLAKEQEVERQRILELALADIDGRTKDDVGEMGSALYIMVSKLGVKIGISDEPEKRLGQVQTGHPAKVTLGKVIWFFSRDDAALVEKTVHDLLKLQNAHSIGEWFTVKFAEATDAVGKIVRDLIQKGLVDSHRVAIQSKNLQTEVDLRLVKLVSGKWRISKKGNDWLKLGDKVITIFSRQSRWSYVCAGEYSKTSFDTKKEAKIAALQLYLERYGDGIPS